MLFKVSQKVENSCLNKIITKVFTRNLQEITTKSAYNNGKLYYKEWQIKEYARPIIKYSRSYSGDKLIPNSQLKLDYKA